MEGLYRVSSMKMKLEFILDDNDEVNVQLDNPGNVDIYKIVGLIEKIKTEILISSPAPEIPMENGNAC